MIGRLRWLAQYTYWGWYYDIKWWFYKRKVA